MNKLWNLQNYSGGGAAPNRQARRVARPDSSAGASVPAPRSAYVCPLAAGQITRFPIRVNVYIPNTKKIRANDGDLCYGRCFVPDDPDDSITIDVAGATTMTATFGRCKITRMGNHLHAGARAVGALLPVPEPRFADSARD